MIYRTTDIIALGQKIANPLTVRVMPGGGDYTAKSVQTENEELAMFGARLSARLRQQGWVVVGNLNRYF